MTEDTPNPTGNAPSIVVQISDTTARPVQLEGPVREGILATATNGGDPAVELTPQTLITLPNGWRMSLATAERNGFVTKDADGRYTEVDQTVRAAEEQAKADAADESRAADQIVLPEATEADLGHIMTGLSEMGVNADNVIAELLGTRALPAVFVDLATQFGVSVAEMEQRVSGVFRALGDEVDERVLIPQGIEPAHFREWLRGGESVPRHQHNKAVLLAFHGRRLDGYRWLAEKYKASPAYSRGPTRLPGATELAKNQHGQTIVRQPNSPFWQTPGGTKAIVQIK